MRVVEVPCMHPVLDHPGRPRACSTKGCRVPIRVECTRCRMGFCEECAHRLHPIPKHLHEEQHALAAAASVPRGAVN